MCLIVAFCCYCCYGFRICHVVGIFRARALLHTMLLFTWLRCNYVESRMSLHVFHVKCITKCVCGWFSFLMCDGLICNPLLLFSRWYESLSGIAKGQHYLAANVCLHFSKMLEICVAPSVTSAAIQTHLLFAVDVKTHFKISCSVRFSIWMFLLLCGTMAMQIRSIDRILLNGPEY